MAVVNDINSHDPLGFYTFFRDTLGCRFLQFAPIVERLDQSGRQLAPFEPGGTIAPYSVDPVEWGRFLNTIFDTWVRSDVGSMFVQIFDTTLASWLGLPPGTCVFGDTCGHSPVMEHNGDLFTCDHFAYPDHRLGNILDTPLITMILSHRLRSFGADKRDALPSRCQACQWLRLCHGECPKNRIIPTGELLSTPDADNINTTRSGDLLLDTQAARPPEKMLNYLCSGYSAYFAHTAPYMQTMAELYRRNLPVADIMKMAPR